VTNVFQGTELSEDNLNATIIQNILQAFRSIHALGVIHSDVRKENILVREDNSVVIVDFEMSSFMDVTADQMALEEKIVEELLDDLQGPGCQCTARTSKVTAEIGV
jgi:serine/threonine protein kinase